MENFSSEIIVGILLILLNLVVKKYIEPKLLEKNKAISYIKKFLLFNIKYTLNIVYLIFFSINFEFHKLYVFMVSFFMCLIFFNLMSDYFNFILKKYDILLHEFASEIDNLNGIKTKANNG